MKSKPTQILFALWLALTLAFLPALRAQEPPPVTPAPAEQPAPPDEPADQEKPAPSTPAPEAEQPAPPEAAAEGDKPAPESAVETPAGDKSGLPESIEQTTPEPEKPAKQGSKSKRVRTIGVGPRHESRSGNERVSFFQDSTLAENEKAEAVVSIVGSSSSDGEVGDAVVSVLGSSTSSGKVGGAVVSVIGNTRVNGGTVGDVAVAVLGSTYVNGHVRGEVVAVLGNVELGPEAIVDGDLVCVGGTVKRDAKAQLHGDVHNIAIGGHQFNFDGLHAWFAKCVLYGRPLAFGENLMWVWWIALACLGFYVLVALVAPGGVTKCVQTLEERPGKSILAALLTMLLTPVAYLLLALTLFIAIGAVLIPIFSMGLFFAVLFGKVVMLAWIGRRITKLLGDGPLAHPVFAVLIGGLIVLGLYTVPILGFVLYKLLGILGLGVVVYTLLLSYKSSRPVPPKPAVAAGVVAAVPPVIGPEAPAATFAALPPVISASTLERAGFWHRLAASLLDAVMVGIVFGMMHSFWHGFGGIYPFWYAVYCVIMWATKGTTIGGVICGIKVVRLDDRPVNWSVAIVRALSGFLSLAVAGLGFIWVAFDNERQSWHDKIAGTTIVRVPKGTSLI